MVNTIAIKKRMLDLGLTNSELAKLISVNPCYLSTVINGKKSLTLSIAGKLQHALQISNEEFMFYFMHSE